MTALQNKWLIVIGGPTASGKTKLAIALAHHFGAEILSADSRQFYRQMNIGTAKPSDEELRSVKHHFINSLDISQQYDVGAFEQDALLLLDSLFAKHHVAILVGGSGFYIKAVCEGLDVFPSIPASVREELLILLNTKGIQELQHNLKALDAASYEAIDLNNPHRLIRALEVCLYTGRPFSSFKKQAVQKRDFGCIYVKTELPIQELNERINHRVDDMMEAGLLEEVRELQAYKHHNALQTVGYQELIAFLDGQISLPQAVELIKTHTRQYAKRQRTWFRKDARWIAVDPESIGQSIQIVENIISGHDRR